MPTSGIKPDALDELAKRSSHVVFSAKTAKPLSRSNIVTICPNRITITYGGFMGNEEYPLPIDNVIGARINSGMIFSTLIIETFGYQKPDPIKYLLTKDARLARRYILALVECNKNKIDLTGYSLSELKNKLKLIGMVRH